MTPSIPVQRVVDRLTTSGYRSLGATVKVASISFEFPAILIGSDRALDLIAVADTLMESEARLRQKIEGLSRALDLAASRRPFTVILVGPVIRSRLVETISRVCRVLVVGTPTGPDADSTLSHALAVLLPLNTPTASETVIDPLGEVRARLDTGSDHETVSKIEELLIASGEGPEVVREVLRLQLLQALSPSGTQDRLL